MHVIKCYATDTDYNISSDYDGLSQAVCLDQDNLGWKHFLQGKLFPDWMDIINNERSQLGLPPNFRAVPQMMTALITTTINLWRTRCEFMHGGRKREKKLPRNGESYPSRWTILRHEATNLDRREGTTCQVHPKSLHNFGSFGHGFV